MKNAILYLTLYNSSNNKTSPTSGSIEGSGKLNKIEGKSIKISHISR